jgi:hypothetical protein
MVYGLYLTLDQTQWFRGDYSDEDLLTGTIYSDINKVTAKNLTGYTLKVKMFRSHHFGALTDFTATIVTAASGTWSYAVTASDMPPRGNYFVKVELSKSGTAVSTLNRVQLNVLQGPSP